MSNQVYIFDTTLRDGEQSPGASMTLDEKVKMALQLERMGVDIIEAGFPAASEGEFEAVREIARIIKKCTVAALTRTTRGDIHQAWEAVQEAVLPRIHIFIATSDIHLKHKLQMSRAEVLKESVEAVKYAKRLTDEVEYSAEDATRTDLDFLCDIVRAVVDAGATIINLPDTVGYTMPEEFGTMFRTIREKVPGSEKIILSTHCHNDLGLAVANSLAALKEGVRQLECTINGIGERAGNASLEEIVMAIRTREDLLPYYTDVESKEIYKSSRLLSSLTGLIVPHNKPIVGKNAFAHEAGIHQHGVIREALTYEIMTPGSVGAPDSSLILGKHSGKHGLAQRYRDLGYDLTDDQMKSLYEQFIQLADKKKEIFDDDLLALLDEETKGFEEFFSLEYLQTTSGNRIEATATVKLKRNDESFLDSAVGDGPVDATYKTIDRITGVQGKLMEYSVNAVTTGKDAVGEVFVTVDFGKVTVIGRASSTDIIEASAKAYLNALNKAYPKLNLA